MVYLIINIIYTEKYVEWDENKTIIESINTVHNACKNTKIVQALQQMRDDERRVGLVKRGETRWWTIMRQIEHLKKNKDKHLKRRKRRIMGVSRT